MKNTELRVGNLLLNGKVTEVGENHITVHDGYQYWHSDVIRFETIPLNEHWLLKFGFEKIKNDMYINGYEYKLETDGLEFNGIGGSGWINNKDKYLSVNTLCRGNYCANSVKYVHELQNLFFALTGEELQQTE